MLPSPPQSTRTKEARGRRRRKAFDIFIFHLGESRRTLRQAAAA